MVLPEKKNELTPIAFAKDRTTPSGVVLHYLTCRCDCGNFTEVAVVNFNSSNVKSCGCRTLRKSLERNGTSFTRIDSNLVKLHVTNKDIVIESKNLEKVVSYSWFYDKTNNSISTKTKELGKIYILNTLFDSRLNYRISLIDKTTNRFVETNIIYKGFGPNRHKIIQLKDGKWTETDRKLSEQSKRIDKASEHKNTRLAQLKEIAKKHKGELLTPGYLGARELHRFRCEKGHVFSTTASSVIAIGTWCKRCGAQDMGLKRRLPISEIQKRAEKFEGKVLDEENLGTGHYFTWECKYGHQFKSTLGNVTSGYWCPTCAEGKSELFCRELFESLFNKPFIKANPEFLTPPSDLGVLPLELDGYNAELGIAFEHQGIQHYKYIPYFHKYPGKLDLIKKRDAFKVQRCKEVGIKLVVIPAVDVLLPRDQVRTFIITTLNSL